MDMMVLCGLAMGTGTLGVFAEPISINYCCTSLSAAMPMCICPALLTTVSPLPVSTSPLSSLSVQAAHGSIYFLYNVTLRASLGLTDG